MYDLRAMQLAYLEALYFTETGDNGQPSADTSLTALCHAKALNDCADFYQAVKQNLLLYLPELDWSRVGYDFWLTRNGHGTGFWDRPEIYGEVGAQMLAAMAQACGEHDAEFEDGEPETDIDRALRQTQMLRDEGFAVVVFYPEELGKVDPRRIEGRLVDVGVDAIDILKGVGS